MHLEQAIAALRFDPAAAGLAARGARRAVRSPCSRLGVAARAGHGVARLRLRRAAALARRPALVRGDAARPCPISACWWSTRPPRCRSATARISPKPRAQPHRAAGARPARPRAAHDHRARKAAPTARACSPPSTARSPTSRARGWPASSPSPTGRSTTCPANAAGRRAAARADRRHAARRPTAASASSTRPSYGIVGKIGALRVAVEDLGVPDTACHRSAGAR